MKGRVAIVGAAESDYGILPGSTALQLHVQAAKRALADAGLTRDDVDGVFSTGGSYGMMPLIGLIEYMGLKPRYVDSTNTGGALWEFMVEHAIGALQAGLCTVALLTYGACPRSDVSGAGGPGQSPDGPGTRFSAAGTPVAFEDPFGMPLPARGGLVASRHMYQYGTTSEQLAAVAVAIRRNASLNPNAMYRKPITVEDVLASPLISDPLHRLDCCVVTDGGGAVVLTTLDRARDLKAEPVLVLGTGGAIASETLAGWAEFPDVVATQSGKLAYQRAGLGPEDIDTLQLYDAYTINILLQLEALGFCKPGESGPFVEDGRLAYDGALPTNTDGGGLSSNHPGMRGMFLLIEAVRQLRHQAGEAQVPGAEVALCNGTGGPYSSCGTVILGRQR
jgi:acetyl-CoA acetyltransferase